jgi:hypothetical protein
MMRRYDWNNEWGDEPPPQPPSSWQITALLIVSALLAIGLPDAIFSVLHPNLRKGFEVIFSWCLLGATMVALWIGITLWRRSIKRGPS